MRVAAVQCRVSTDVGSNLRTLERLTTGLPAQTLVVAPESLLSGYQPKPGLTALLNPDKSGFKGPFARRRCLVAADGWYEWTGAKGAKQRHLFTPKDGTALTFAGLWERWTPPEGESVESFTIVTQPAGAPLTASTTALRLSSGRKIGSVGSPSAPR